MGARANLDYDPNIERVRAAIATRVTGSLRSRDMTARSFAEQHYSALGFGKQSSAGGYLSCVMKGRQDGTTTNHTKGRRFKPKESERLPILLRLIDVRPDDELISQIREVLPDFVYD